MSSPSNEKHTLYESMTGGPLGLGDPDDKTLRHVERDILIPKLVKDLAKVKCDALVKAFSICGRDSGLLMPFKCRTEAREMQECMLKWFEDDDLNRKGKELYLEQRTTFRATGVGQRGKRYEA